MKAARRKDKDKEATTVFIVAASDVVRAGLHSLVEGDERFAVLGSARSLAEFFAGEDKQASLDVVVFDAEQRTNETLDSWRLSVNAASDNDDGPVFVVIGAEDDEWLKEAFHAGIVRALLPHAAKGSEILAAIEAAAAGLISIGAEMLEMLAALISSLRAEIVDDASARALEESMARAPIEETAAFDALTPREREVLEMLAEGLANKEIAYRLKISEHTVKFHVASIFAKLDVSTRTEAVMQGVRRGLIMM